MFIFPSLPCQTFSYLVDLHESRYKHDLLPSISSSNSYPIILLFLGGRSSIRLPFNTRIAVLTFLFHQQDGIHGAISPSGQ